MHSQVITVLCRWVEADRVEYEDATVMYRALILLTFKAGATMAACGLTKVGRARVRLQ